jgi:hypothetical protein
MNHPGDLVPGEHLVQQGAVAHVAFDEIGRGAADACQALQHPQVAVAQVVQDERRVARLGQGHAGVAADEARAARHQDAIAHVVYLVRFVK